MEEICQMNFLLLGQGKNQAHSNKRMHPGAAEPRH